ncbi:hypothetical protein N836_21325 [Leptolyngbya sp. Heron Island J]|nr:hypothetical protein N836_21325 [Leptolyngbya sp. Heron Island J]
MTDRYTAITFAPVQGFIEKSRKLRDLYGSSYLLSFLAWSICKAADRHGYYVKSPALINVTQGMPNQIIIDGIFDLHQAEKAFSQAWGCVVHACRLWIENSAPQFQYCWKREWGLWIKYAWEFYGAHGPDIPTARQRLNDQKQSRAWTGINWTGESSTLSGADGIAWHKLGYMNPRQTGYQTQKREINDFYKALSSLLGEAFIDPDEELSVPELIKRMVTHETIANAVLENFQERSRSVISPEEKVRLLAIAQELNPTTFKDLNRLKKKDRKPSQPQEPKYWTGWFLGDGDSAGNYLKRHSGPDELVAFSSQMREWGNAIRDTEQTYLLGQGRMIYAGGDDFLGVLYEKDSQLQPTECWQWFQHFNRNLWQGETLQAPSGKTFQYRADEPKPITASVGFVWAAPDVPQRDVLQHCHTAEQSAKQGGRDRIAFRILFNGGNHLEWICPWWVLEAGHIDITQNRLGISEPKQAWARFYNDVAMLEGRHAFGVENDNQVDVAKSLFQIYFGEENTILNEGYWWNQYDDHETLVAAGILGNQTRFIITDTNDPDYGKPLPENRYVKHAINSWVISLAKVGFHLNRPLRQPQAVAA